VDLTGKLDATDRDNQLLYLTWGPTITHMDGNKNQCGVIPGAETQGKSNTMLAILGTWY